MQNSNVSEAQRNKGRRDLILLMAIFFTPIIIALVLYTNLDKWGIGGERNHGDLIQPPRQLQDVQLQDINNSSFKFSDVRDKWLLIQLGPASCDEQCQQRLYLMRQIRLATGGDRHRVERIYVSLDGKPQSSLLETVKQHEGLRLVYGEAGAIDKVVAQFGHDVGEGEALQAMYIVDPRGFLMMSYPAGFEPRGAIKDLTRLLKFARAG